MRYWLLSCCLCFSLFTTAQEQWNDYIVGRPFPGYMEAKKTIAEAWGIQYQAIAAGCVISDEITAQAKAYDEQNQIYFKTIAARFGDDWQHYFNLEVQKKLYQERQADLKKTWYEVLPTNSSQSLINSHKATAEAWGIPYATILADTEADLTTEQKEQLTASAKANKQLNAFFGHDWQKDFNREATLLETIKVQKTKQHTCTWTEAAAQTADQKAYQKAKATAAAIWGIQYKAVPKGSKAKQQQLACQNEAYLKRLTEIYGKDWQQHFERVVQQNIQ